LAPIDGPPANWESPTDIFKATLEHEEYVTSRINKLMDMAIAESDHALKSHLQWFVDEQVEEESTANTILGKLKLAQGAPQMLLMMDNEMATRVFTPPTNA
jgi:ferritin